LCRGSHRRGSWVGAKFTDSEFTSRLRNVSQNKRLAVVCFSLLVLLAVVCGPVRAQVMYGAIVGTLKDDDSADRLHPNAEGYNVMAPIATAAIQKAIQ